MKKYDVIVIGAGAAGLFCAGLAGQRGLSVLLIDHSERVAEKIRISGGGRANFTNRELDLNTPEKHFISENPRFCRGPIARYTPEDFVELINRYGIAWHEKHKGQLFFDRSAEDLINLLLTECEKGQVERWQPCSVGEVFRDEQQSYRVATQRGEVCTQQLVVATGGLSIPKIGATDWGQRLAQKFGHRIVSLRPALVPLTFDQTHWLPFASLAGLSLPVVISTGKGKNKGYFEEDLLFTHRGLSGPAVLQISSYWQENESIAINLLPESALGENLREAKLRSRKLIANELTQYLPSRLADAWTGQQTQWQRPINEASDNGLTQLAESLENWRLTPNGSEGYRKAEVTAGGVDTRELSSQTMESQKSPGLFFIGEVVDVTGWLGGYNFQWAWSSAWVCAQSLSRSQTNSK